jgi:hypothetical protein
METLLCPYCSHATDADSRFCMHCGKPQPVTGSPGTITDKHIVGGVFLAIASLVVFAGLTVVIALSLVGKNMSSQDGAALIASVVFLLLVCPVALYFMLRRSRPGVARGYLYGMVGLFLLGVLSIISFFS